MVVLMHLKAARELLAKGWTKGSFARNKDNNCTLVDMPDACKWCALGAIYAPVNESARWRQGQPHPLVTAAIREVESTLRQRGCDRDIVRFNDAQTSAEPVLEVFDETIARLEADVV